MVLKEENDDLIRRYLLGQLTEQPELNQEVEGRLLGEDDFVAQLEVIEAELIEDYVHGRLSAREKTDFEKHFALTPQRRQQLATMVALQKYTAQNPAPVVTAPSSTSRSGFGWLSGLFSAKWQLAALAMLALIAGFGVWRAFFYQSPVDKGLVALAQAYREQRPLEARLSGFAYAPWPNTRGSSEEKVDYLARDRAASFIHQAFEDSPGAATHHALGQLYLARGEFDKAIDQFNEALKAGGNDAQLYSDFGVALLEKGKAISSPEDAGQKLELFGKSLTQLDKALELNPSLPEALFNRALCYQYLVLPKKAEADWRKYLEIDARSPWADEAKRRLGSLEEQKKKSAQSRKQILDDYLHAWRAGDDKKAWEIACENKESATGNLIFQQLAVAYLRAKLGGQANAADYIEALSSLGEWELQKSNDHYIAELADFYHRLPPQQLSLLVQAYALLEQGRANYLASRYDEATKLFMQASQAFKRAGDRWEERFATYLITSCYLQSSRAKDSLSLLELLAQQCENDEHQWLLAHVLAATGRALVTLKHYSKSIEYINRSLAISEQINDTYNVQKSLGHLALQYHNFGEPHRALTFLQRYSEIANAHWPSARQLCRSYETAALTFAALDMSIVAAAYEQEALRLAIDEIKDPSFSYVCYINLGYIYGKMRRYDDGIKYIQRGLEISQSMSSETAIAWSSLQLGHAYRQEGRYSEADACYDQAIDLSEKLDAKWMSYDVHKGRFLCYLAQRNSTSASKELAMALDLLERDRSTIAEESSRNSLFNREVDIYDLAVDFEYSCRHDNHKAFEYAETSRARSLLDLTNEDRQVVANNSRAEIRLQNVARPLSLIELQAGMPEQAQILQYSVLDNKLLIWLLSKSRFEVREQPISRQELGDKIAAWLKLISRTPLSSVEEVKQHAEELYKILITPVEPLLDTSKLLCISPDEELHYLPFGALIAPQSGHPLIVQYALILAPSSTIFVASSNLARQKENVDEEKILSVGNPHFDKSAFPSLHDLHESGKEALAVAKQYQAWPLTEAKATKENVKRDIERAEVIHIASHYVVNSRSPLLSQLLLTAPPSSEAVGRDTDGVLHAWEIYTMNLRPARLVVLSACSTGVERYYRGEGAIGAARAFLAAGAPLVVASLWPVDSNATAELMVDFHSYRKQLHLSSLEALRRAQLKMLNSGRYQQPYYWAAFTAIGGYSNY